MGLQVACDVAVLLPGMCRHDVRYGSQRLQMAVREMSVRDAGLLLLAIGLIMCLIIGAGAFAAHRNSRLAQDFGRIHVGLTDREVLSVLGKPSWIEACGKSFGNPKADCTEYIYRNSFAPLIPYYWSVSFNDSRQVVDTYVYGSP